MRKLPSTVRFRVTALATAVVIVVLVGVGYGLVTNQRQTLTESLDEMMAGRVDELAATLSNGESPDLDNLGEDDSVAQIVTPDGEVLASSTRLRGQPPIGEPIASGQTISSIGRRPGFDDESRLLTRVVETADGDVVIIHFAAVIDDVSESVTALVTSMTVAVPVVAAVLAALVWIVVGRTLRPVERIRAEVAAIGGSDLDRRVAVPDGDDEIVRLARTMNDMLERVEEASRRQRRFVADASHELRSPLTRMRSELEVDLAHPNGANPAATHESVLEEVEGLQRLVDDLLLLARNDDADRRAARRNDHVDVAEVATRIATGLTGRGRLAVEVVAPGPSYVRGNGAELARALSNLVDNALRHARSVVRIEVAEDSTAGVSIAVADDGPGIAEVDRERIFERFTRLDESRTSTDGGTGLGLAITRDIIVRHGGTIAAGEAPEGGARFVIAFPRHGGQ